MTKFALRKLEAIVAKQEVDELVIDGIGQLEFFEQELDKSDSRYLSEFKTLKAYIEYAANGKSLGDTKFKDVTPQKEDVKEYEFKSKHLRIYAIKKDNGKIIVLGGFKNTQKQDFKRFRSLKKQYLDSL
jgi:putative component of toxin-antitoxin plasmid stabilization module